MRVGKIKKDKIELRRVTLMNRRDNKIRKEFEKEIEKEGYESL